jgi:hypothetical protein
MHEAPHHGLSRRELDYQLSWLMRRRPQDPAKLPDFIGELVVTLIDRNNAALARHAAQGSPLDRAEGP